ncbi:Helix-turn-helix protein [Opitutaceae bacterium TAV1]|nr:Helix-turn-helix protein [Opitutaceae bacterium TAV1]
MKKTAPVNGRNIVGANVRRIRMSQDPKVTLEDMAGRLAARGVQLDRSAIGRIENDDRYVLDYEAVALADALGVDVADLFRKIDCPKNLLRRRAG